jgi:hypothetical protein
MSQRDRRVSVSQLCLGALRVFRVHVCLGRICLNGRALALHQRLVDAQLVALHVIAAQGKQLFRPQTQLDQHPNDQMISPR